LLFRVEFGAGLIKLRGDPCWRDLTCLYYHHETQPMPNPLSWFFHHLPRPLHKAEVAGNHFAQLIAPVGLAFPQPISDAAGLVIIVTQLWLVLSGHFSWLHWITIVCAVSALDNAALSRLLPIHSPAITPQPIWPQVAPYHLRLDWLMWFAAMSSPGEHTWFIPLLIKLLENDPPTVKLIKRNPFAEKAPAYVRARLYRYRFSTPAERRTTRQWWMRQLVGDYVPPVRLRLSERDS